MRIECELWTAIVGRPLGALSNRPLIHGMWAVVGSGVTIVALVGLATGAMMFLVGPAIWTRSLVAGTPLERLLPASLSVIAMTILLAFVSHLRRSTSGQNALDVDLAFVSLGAALSALLLLWASAMGWPAP